MLRTHRRVTLVALSSLFVAGAMILVLISPLGIYELVAVQHTDWERLSYVGQTYGAVSALLDAAALVGVVVSVLLQVRETALSRVQAGRSRHFELIQMAMQDPLLMQAFHSLSDSAEANRLNAYVSLLIQNLQMLWDSRDIEEDELRSNLADLLVTDAGRRYWQQFGHVRMSLFTDRRRQQEFVQIIDEVSRTPGRAVGAA
jgi:uncharacterized protein DUF6082